MEAGKYSDNSSNFDVKIFRQFSKFSGKIFRQFSNFWLFFLCLYFVSNVHMFIFILQNDYDFPFFAYIPGAI